VEEIASKFASGDLQNFCRLASKKSAVSAGFSGLRGNTGSNSIFQEETFSLFQGSKNGPTIITLLPLNHRFDFRSDCEY